MNKLRYELMEGVTVLRGGGSKVGSELGSILRGAAVHCLSSLSCCWSLFG